MSERKIQREDVRGKLESGEKETEKKNRLTG
jgi:hypothetical protein